MKLDPQLFTLTQFEIVDLLYLGRKAVEIHKRNKYPIHTFEGNVLTVTFRFTDKGGLHIDKLERKNG